MSKSEYVPIHELMGGEVFIGWGPGWTVEQPAQYLGEGDVGGWKDRQRWLLHVVHEDGSRRSRPGDGHSKIHVIRN